MVCWLSMNESYDIIRSGIMIIWLGSEAPFN